MGTMVSTRKGNIVNVSFGRLHDMFTRDTFGARFKFLGLSHVTSYDSLRVYILKFEGAWASKGFCLYGTTNWKDVPYTVKVSFIFYPDGNMEKVAGVYELQEIDSDDPSHPSNMGKPN